MGFLGGSQGDQWVSGTLQGIPGCFGGNFWGPRGISGGLKNVLWDLRDFSQEVQEDFRGGLGGFRQNFRVFHRVPGYPRGASEVSVAFQRVPGGFWSFSPQIS